MDGSPIVRVNGKWLHSSYYPWREAQRCLPERYAGCYLVLGEGLGYLSRLIRDRQPNCRLLVFFCDKRLAHLADLPESSEVWCPGAAVDAADFLRRRLSAAEFPDIEVVGWPASERIFPRVYAAVQRAVLRVLRRMQSEFATIAAFGRLWLRNTLENWIELPESSTYVSPPLDAWRGQPVLIAAAGPGLNDCVPWIRRYRDRFRLLACTSALATLAAAGIRADCAVSSDPGWLARRHYAYLPEGLPLLLPFGAQPFRGFPSGPIVPFLQGNLWEGLLPASATELLLKVEENGTVIGSALLLTQCWHSSVVVVAGLDLACFDVQDHSVPHAFDPLFLGGTRFSPLEQRCWLPLIDAIDCGGGWRQTRSLREYQLWFEEFARHTDVELYQLGDRRLAGWNDAKPLLARLEPLPPYSGRGAAFRLRPRTVRRLGLEVELARMARELSVDPYPGSQPSPDHARLLALAPLHYRDFLRGGRTTMLGENVLVRAREQLSMVSADLW